MGDIHVFWNQVPAAMFQHLVESFPRTVEAVIEAKGGSTPFNGHDIVMRCLTSRCPHTFGHVVYVGYMSAYMLTKPLASENKCTQKRFIQSLYPRRRSLIEERLLETNSVSPFICGLIVGVEDLVHFR